VIESQSVKSTEKRRPTSIHTGATRTRKPKPENDISGSNVRRTPLLEVMIYGPKPTLLTQAVFRSTADMMAGNEVALSCRSPMATQALS
jgi:hypothetical protein